MSKSPRQGDSEKETLRSSARQFEAMFIAEMLRLTPMAKGIGGAFSGGFGEEAARSFLIDAVAEDMVAQGGLGLSDDFLESMMRKDET